MEQPPIPPSSAPSTQPSTTTAATTTATPTVATSTFPLTAPVTHPHPDSVESSPRSRTTDSWEDPPPAVAAAVLSPKLRLMCSYGGHIVPRPHDKSLCYIGGDTRILVAERNTTLASLSSRLSQTFLNGRPFTLKYQLPSEDLDSLISVTTDEDFDNMIDEYDRIVSSNSIKPSRLRLFLFPLKPESSQSIGPILESAGKSEDWFLTALNEVGLLSRGFSDPNTVNCLLGLDDEIGSGRDGNANGNGNGNGGGSGVIDSGTKSGDGSIKEAKQHQGGQDGHSMPDSPKLENSSSFDSTSSSPSMMNLPPIRVGHVEESGGGGGGIRAMDQKMGIEEQFSQINVNGGLATQQQDEGFVVISSTQPIPATLTVSGVPVSGAVAGDYQGKAYSDNERSDHCVPASGLKPIQQQNLLLPQAQQKPGSDNELPSPDSVSGSLNPAAGQRPFVYQEQVNQIPSGMERVAYSHLEPKITVSDPNTRIPVQDSGYTLQLQSQQQQQQHQHQQHYVPAGAHYIHHYPPGAVTIPGYYPVYPSQHHHQAQFDQQYPIYYLPAQPRQPQAYNPPVQQPNVSEPATTNPSSHPQTPPAPAAVPTPSPAAYNQVRHVIPKPEIAAGGAYRTAGAPQLVQLSSGQQYVAYSHMPPPAVARASGAAANYAYEPLGDPAHPQVYYAQQFAPPMHSQFQPLAAPAPESSAQIPTDSTKLQIRTSQPL